MNKVLLLPRYFLKWNKLFWFFVIGNPLFFVIVEITNFDNPITGIILVLLFFASIRFGVNSSILPSNKSNADGFSVKYLCSLPLTKGELLLGYGLTTILMSLPVLSILVFAFSEKNVGPLFVVYILAAFLIGTQSLCTKILRPNGGYLENLSRRKRYLVNFRNVLLVSTALSFIFYFGHMFGFSEHLNIDSLADKIGEFFSSWYFVPAFIVFNVLAFKSTLKAMDRKDIPSRKQWKPKRDIPLTGVCAASLAILITVVMAKLPVAFQGSQLHAAIHGKDLEQIKLLIDQGADINFVNKDGFSPLMAAALGGDTPVFDLLLEKGASTKGKSLHGSNLLHQSLMGKNTDIVEKVLEMGFDPNQESEYQNLRPIHYASIHCLQKAVDKLVEKGAKLEVLDSESRTPLHYAVKNHCFGTTISLLDYGLDPSLKNKDGKTALETSKRLPKDLVSYLEKRIRAPASK